jgi:solute carrier family 25 carnitine/acylcarnitine transporter 20/29
MGDMAGELDDSEVNFERVGKELFAGGISGVFGVIVGLPFDLIKVRMQVNPDLYRSGISCFIKTVKTDGFFSLYRGMMAPGACVCVFQVSCVMSYHNHFLSL